MALEYSLVPIKDHSKGIDARSAPSSIKDGYLESILNGDSNTGGQVSTRKGYQGYFGWVPLRASRIQHSGTDIKFRIGSTGDVNFTDLWSTPILVYGKVPSDDTPVAGFAGDFSDTATIVYYPYFSTLARIAVSAGSGTLSFTTSDTGIEAYHTFVDMVKSTHASKRDWSSLWPDSVTISQTTYQIDVGYTAAEAENYFVYLLDRQSMAGQSYVSSQTAVTSVTVTAATHSLDNFNIMCRCFDTGTSVWAIPDTVTISSAGSVTVTFATAFTGDIVLTSVPFAQTVNTGLVAGDNTIQITGLTSPYVFVSVYRYSAGNYIQILPGSMSYDADSTTLDIDINVPSGTETVDIYYEYADIVMRADEITVTDTGAVSETYSSTDAEITIWGIPHDGIYTDSASSGGHVTHLDTYRTSSEERLICGLGGTLFAARTYSEVASTYNIPRFYSSLSGRINSDTSLYPLFDTTGSSASRTRGLVTDASISSNLARVTGVEYVSSGVADYTLSFTSKTGTISTSIDVTNDTDYLTVTGMAYSINNGTFQISSVQSESSTAAVIRVVNSLCVSDDFDESGCDGRAGVFTDQFMTTANTYFLAGDTLSTEDTTGLTISSVEGTTVVLSGIDEAISLNGGSLVYGTRTTTVFRVRNVTGTVLADNIVRGDMLTASNLDRELRVKYVNGEADNTISTITVTGTSATVTTSSTHYLQPGQKVWLINTGVSAYDGLQTIVTAPTATTFTFTTSTATGCSQGTVVGQTVEIDESLSISDGRSAPSYTVTGRWIPIEAPSSADDLPKEAYSSYFDSNDYGDQPRLRSTTIADSMFFVNDADEVMKFDGTNIYQGGIFRWQPQLFVNIDSTGSIGADTTTITEAAAASGRKFTVVLGEEIGVSVGDRIIHSEDSAKYTVVVIDDDGTNGIIIVDKVITGTSGAGTLTRLTSRKYYFRLNAIDANNNIIASATTGAEDCVAEFTTTSNVNIRAIGFPVWGVYDYDRLELQVYCTKTTAALFYLNRNIDISFSAGYGYIDIVDATPDELLVDIDEVSTKLTNGELGNEFSQPLRAKYITNSDNRLVLLNCRDYPQLDIVLRVKPGSGSVTSANLSGKTFLFRKDNTDTDSDTDMLNRVVYEFVTSGAVTIVPNTDIDNTNSGYFTVAETGHGLVDGDWVYMFHSAQATDKPLTFAGWWQIEKVNDNSFRVNTSLTGTTAAASTDVNRYVCASTKSDIPVWLGTDGNYNWRTSNTSNSYEQEAVNRLCAAINCSIRMVDTSLTDFETFEPWMVANAGSEYEFGQLIVRQPKAVDDTLEVQIPVLTGSETWTYYINGIKRGSTGAVTQVSAVTKLFPSRAIISYENYPEVFGNPFGSQALSDSAVDINAADGQEITGGISFFGDSTFGTAQIEGVVAVFKSGSPYLLNVVTKEVQKVESAYGGCTIPDSIRHTKDGIIFANESGVYRLNRDMSVSPIGEFLSREWDNVELDSKSQCVGFNYKEGNRYLLSVPYGSGQDVNNYVFSYQYTSEGKTTEYAPWSVYDNFPATGWANRAEEAMFSSTDGQVFKIRMAGDSTDYRDDDEAVDFQVVFRAEDFGLPGVRKKVPGILVEFYNNELALAGTLVYTAVDMSSTFTACDSGAITETGYKVTNAWFTPVNQKCERMQLKIVNQTIDSPVTIAGIAYKIAVLTTKGVRKAAEL